MRDRITLDAAIYAAVKENESNTVLIFENSDKTLPDNFTAQQLEKIITDEINLREKRSRNKKIRKIVLGMVSAFSVAFFIFFFPLLTVSAVRETITETIIRTYKDHITIETVIGKDIAPREVKDINVRYMAEGFVLESEDLMGSAACKSYVSDKGYLTVHVKPESMYDTLSLDNEHSSFYTIEIDGIQGMLMCSEGGYNLLYITKEHIVYRISGFTGIDELLKIYDNLEIVI